ncbi:MAG TPA: NADH-quinone oxidoreductase subunit J [Dehalococcoidia bacterium]|nr:NADH-quinone oxidoreductase subunit J [Dehalococcoidia bacterium]
MDEPAVIVAFWVLAVLTLGSALMVAVVRDLIHAVLFLILSFVGVAGLYITLSADFVAVVQVLIYAGAVSVLMLFAILLTPRSARDNAPVPYSAPLSALAGLIGAVIIFVAVQTDWAKAGDDGRFQTTASEIGRALLNPYVLPFEVASVLLVIAMVGAIVLVRPASEEEGA